MPKTIGRARAMNFGGREGVVRIRDTEQEFTMPKSGEAAGAHTASPEQLLAAGWAGSFGGTVLELIRAREIPVETFMIRVDVALIEDDDGSRRLAADLVMPVTGINQARALRLMEDAYAIDPFSKAVRGNVYVRLLPEMKNESSFKEELP
jgi:Ohr subfamily peroxiredoxin